jgi:Tol biopolymer transport system component/imidazolonepropionase-like amidohydrolase
MTWPTPFPYRCAKAFALLACFSLIFISFAEDEDDENDPKKDETPAWDIENPPGPTHNQAIDVTEGTWISLDLSPDGNEIVFDLLGDLYRMPIDGADGSNGVHPEKLTEGMAWDMQPRYSPDGKTIAFTSDRTGKSKLAGDNIWLIDPEDGALSQITDESYQLLNGPAWSPDGNYIVARKHFTSRRSLGAGEMWLYHRSGVESNAQGGVQLTKKPTEQKDVNEPVFSPNGKYLYYSEDVSPGSDFEYSKDPHKQIYAIKRKELATDETESYITGPGGACRPTPSPDGKTIAFVRRVDGKTGLHLFDTQTGAIRLLNDQLERDMQETWAIHGVYPSFEWTPDGEYLVIWARGKIRKISVADGTESVIPFHIQDERRVSGALRYPVAVAPEEFDVRMLRWTQVTPDGSQVLFQALGHLYLRDLPNGEPQRLSDQNEHFEMFPSISRDGRYVVYTTWNDEELGSVRVASLDRGANREDWTVTQPPGHYTQPVFSPDGQTILYSRVGGGLIRSSLWSRDQGIYRIPAHGGEAKRILKKGSDPQFAASNDRFFYQQGKREKDADNRAFISVDMDGKEAQTHYTSKWATDYQISPDGKWLAFVERFNVYVAPFVATSRSILVGPKGKTLPIAQVSEEAGISIRFSGDSQRLHWSLGPNLFTRELASAYAFLNEGEKIPAEEAIAEQAIGFKTEHARPDTTIALVGAKIVTMGENGTIENGTIIIEGNRIAKIGKRSKVKIPKKAKVIDVSGQVILPGFVDTHAHGSQATHGIIPQNNWVDKARLSFGVTTIHNPSSDTETIFASSELGKVGLLTAPRIFSTGTILYGATGSYKAEVKSLKDAQFHLGRMKSVGAISVKSYNQPRRDQRQQIIAAAREQEMMVVPEGGSTFMHNLTMIVDGHTGIEHTMPVQYIYDDVLDLWRGTGVGYTPTLSVAYGGLWGENYWYAHDDLWTHPRLNAFIPPHILQPRSRRPIKAHEDDYNHMNVATIAKASFDQGGLVQAGGHGQLNGICTHWEIWSFVQGGMTPEEALICGTINGAKYLGLDGDIGSLEKGKLADLIVIEKGYDPTKEIRHSERIQYTMANGNLYNAATMTEYGKQETAKPKFFWQNGNQGIGIPIPQAENCISCPAGHVHLW